MALDPTFRTRMGKDWGERLRAQGALLQEKSAAVAPFASTLERLAKQIQNPISGTNPARCPASGSVSANNSNPSYSNPGATMHVINA